MTKTITPIIHLNGTGLEALAEQLEKSCRAIRAAEEALAEGAPHARDYYPHCDRSAFEIAREQHWARLEKLQVVRSELELIWEAIEEERR